MRRRWPMAESSRSGGGCSAQSREPEGRGVEPSGVGVTGGDDGGAPPQAPPHGHFGDPKPDAASPRSPETAGAKTEPPPAVLTVDELAALLRVNRKTVYDALGRGEIPGARRIGATYRILRDAVLEWLASGQDRVSRSRRFR